MHRRRVNSHRDTLTGRLCHRVAGIAQRFDRAIHDSLRGTLACSHRIARID